VAEPFDFVPYILRGLVMPRRTRAELEADNLVLIRELEEIRNRLDAFLEDEEPDQAEENRDDGDEE
jgi:hypothetical protein